MLFRVQGSVCLLFVSLAACLAGHSRSAFGEDPPTQSLPQPEWEARIEAALDAKGDWSFEEVPLKEVCAAMQEKLGIDIALDVKALENFALDPRTPISLSLGVISNRSFLRRLLGDLELTYTMQFGALWITTPEKARSRLVTKVYPVGDLLGPDAARGESPRDWATLIQAVVPPASWCGSHYRFRLADGTLVQAITSLIRPSTWDFVGGAGAIRGIHDSIVVLQTSDIHEQVTEFLTAYRAVISNDQRNDDERQIAFFLGEHELSAAIRHALDQPFTAEFKDESLKEVIEFIIERTRIPVLDTRALEDFGIDASGPITAKFTGTRLRFVLERILSEQELTFVIRDEVLFITTPSKAEEALLVAFYPVRDLVQNGDELVMEPGGATNVDFDSLIKVIESTIAPDTWEKVGGPAGIATLLPVPTLVIAQSQAVHEEISELLTKLRAAMRLEAVRVADKEDKNPADGAAAGTNSQPTNSGGFH